MSSVRAVITRSHRATLAEHIATVAGELFYRDGIHNVGVDRIADSAGVTKKTLYHHFRSKDLLIAAALRRAPAVRFPSRGTPQQRIAGAFRAAGDVIARSAFRGCPFINATAELSQRDHPARAVILERLSGRRAWFHERAVELRSADPGLLALQLDLLFDGACVAMMKSGDESAVAASILAAAALIAASVGSQNGCEPP